MNYDMEKCPFTDRRCRLPTVAVSDSALRVQEPASVYFGDMEMPGGSGCAASGTGLQSFLPKNCSWPGAAKLPGAPGLLAGLMRPPGAFWARPQNCGEGASVNPAQAQEGQA